MIKYAFLFGIVAASSHTLNPTEEIVGSNTEDECVQWSASTIDYTKNLNNWPIFNQGNCGSCWAFAMATALSIKAQTNISSFDKIFSPGFVMGYLSSSDHPNLKGCNGGVIQNMAHAMQIQNTPKHFSTCQSKVTNPSLPNYCYKQNSPYVSPSDIVSAWSVDINSDGCCTTCGTAFAEECKVSNNYIDAGDQIVKQIKMLYGQKDYHCHAKQPTLEKFNCAQSMSYLLQNYGPIVTGIYVDESRLEWDYGSPADLTEVCQSTSTISINHAVTIVGENQTHWKVQNSWGDGWGDNGYFYVKKGCNYCNMESTFTLIYKLSLGEDDFNKTLVDDEIEALYQQPAPMHEIKQHKSNSWHWYYYAAIAAGCVLLVAAIVFSKKKSTKTILQTGQIHTPTPSRIRL